MVTEIFTAIGKVDVELERYVRRFRSKTLGKPGPIRVELQDDSLKNPILVTGKSLRSQTVYQSVYISPNLTEAERRQYFELRSERNKLSI